jgi:hypothetical protein
MASLDAKALEDIDIIAAFCAESERNHEIIQIVTRFMVIAKIPGAAAVFKKRLAEEKRRKEPHK